MSCNCPDRINGKPLNRSGDAGAVRWGIATESITPTNAEFKLIERLEFQKRQAARRAA
jgi:hypothetical protein